jgi:non-homologous end joining protein Ku
MLSFYHAASAAQQAALFAARRGSEGDEDVCHAAVLMDLASPRVDKEMVDIPKNILERKAGHFDPSKFKDQYEAALKKLVKRKAAGHTIEAKPEPEDRSNVIDLMEALRESMGHRSSAKRRARKPAAKRKRTKRKTA